MRFAFSPLPKKLLQAKLFREPYLRESGRQEKKKSAAFTAPFHNF